MNYINRPKECYTQGEWIEYLEESIRELRKEKENLKKEKGEIRQRLVALEKKLETLSRVKENKELKKENKKLKKYYDRDKEELMESCYGLARENDELKKENENLKEEVRFLEECLDRKEKLNEKYRKKIDELKFRESIADVLPEGKGHIAEETIQDLQARIKELKERIDVLYEFIERNDKLVDEVIDEEDLDKLNRYIYIDDDLVDRTLESED